MNLIEFYDKIGGAYEEVKGRLMTDDRIMKYLNKFLEVDYYQQMMSCIKAENWEDAFRFSHDLKGIGLNLGLGDMAKNSSDLCETMRHGKPQEDISALVELVSQNYEFVCEAIRMIER